MNIYLSGPMTGIADYNRPAFNAAAAALRQQGHTVHNPAEWGDLPTWGQYLARDIHVILNEPGLDAVMLLPGWTGSPGARLELAPARARGLRIIEYATGRTIQVHQLIWTERT